MNQKLEEVDKLAIELELTAQLKLGKIPHGEDGSMGRAVRLEQNLGISCIGEGLEDEHSPKEQEEQW